MKQTAVEWLQEQLNTDMKTMQGHIIQDLLEQAKEMEKEQKNKMYNEIEVLQLLLKFHQTESFDSLYDWFQQNKKQQETFKSE